MALLTYVNIFTLSYAESKERIPNTFMNENKKHLYQLFV